MVGLEAIDDFPLVEIMARERLPYLYDVTAIQRFIGSQTMVAASRWLGEQGIDLILVPVPAMAEVHSEHFVQSCPADGIIAPHVRRSLLELLESDVEVIDGLSLFRPVREPRPDYLYLATDSHWAPRGMRVMAKEVAARLSRYEFARKAKAAGAAPVIRFETQIALAKEDGNGWDSLLPHQRELVRNAPPVQSRRITMPDGTDLPSDPGSPVLVIGSCFARNFREELIAEANLMSRSNWNFGQSTEAFADFLAQPEMLDGVRVVVWVVGEFQFAKFKPLPDPVMAALK
jgi:hypothetical protein